MSNKIKAFLEQEFNKTNLFIFAEDINDTNIINVFFKESKNKFAILYIDKLEKAIECMKLETNEVEE